MEIVLNCKICKMIKQTQAKRSFCCFSFYSFLTPLAIAFSLSLSTVRVTNASAELALTNHWQKLTNGQFEVFPSLPPSHLPFNLIVENWIALANFEIRVSKCKRSTRKCQVHTACKAKRCQLNEQGERGKKGVDRGKGDCGRGMPRAGVAILTNQTQRCRWLPSTSRHM